MIGEKLVKLGHAEFFDRTNFRKGQKREILYLCIYFLTPLKADAVKNFFFTLGETGSYEVDASAEKSLIQRKAMEVPRSCLTSMGTW